MNNAFLIFIALAAFSFELKPGSGEDAKTGSYSGIIEQGSFSETS